MDLNSSFKNNVSTILHVDIKSDMSAVIIHISFVKKQNIYFRRNIWGLHVEEKEGKYNSFICVA